jgi:hypothetical protein
MSAQAPKLATTPIPVQLSEPEFTTFILPHLSMPKRGPKCKLGYHCVFNFILWVLYTGMQWKYFPIPKNPEGKPAHTRGTGFHRLVVGQQRGQPRLPQSALPGSQITHSTQVD